MPDPAADLANSVASLCDAGTEYARARSKERPEAAANWAEVWNTILSRVPAELRIDAVRLVRAPGACEAEVKWLRELAPLPGESGGPPENPARVERAELVRLLAAAERGLGALGGVR